MRSEVVRVRTRFCEVSRGHESLQSVGVIRYVPESVRPEFTGKVRKGWTQRSRGGSCGNRDMVQKEREEKEDTLRKEERVRDGSVLRLRTGINDRKYFGRLWSFV